MFSNIIIEVAQERNRQDMKWGGAAHDDHHTTAEFVGLIEDYAGWARVMAGMDNLEKARNRLIQVAALAVAAVESIDRKTKVEGCDHAWSDDDADGRQHCRHCGLRSSGSGQ